MSGDQTASLIYLLLLGTAVAGYAVVSHRRRLGQAARHFALWGLIFAGLVAGYGLWPDIQRSVLGYQSVDAGAESVTVPRGADGHFHLTLEINGAPVRFIVDTGASDLVLSREDAGRAGLDLSRLDFNGVAQTANGTVSTARVWLDEVTIGPRTDRGVPALVNDGEMPGSLLGIAYLDRFDEVRLADGRLTIRF